METYTLANGVAIPKIGFGTWQIAEGEGPITALASHLRRVTHILIPHKFTVTRFL